MSPWWKLITCSNATLSAEHDIRAVVAATVVWIGLHGVVHAQTGNTVICNRYTDVSNGQVKTEFGTLNASGVFTATATYYNPTSICTVDTLRAISGNTVVDKPLWDANAASFSQSYSITGLVYQVLGNPLLHHPGSERAGRARGIVG